MKIPEFLKINRSPETPHCCHETKDGTGCNATPQTGKKYCFCMTLSSKGNEQPPAATVA